MYTRIFFPLYGSVVRYQIMQQICIFTWPQLTHVTIFWNGNLYKYLFSECFQARMFSKIALLQATDEFLIFRAIAELKSFGFSCLVVGQQYSLDFILVSYFHFKMFGIMADIFLLATICVFSLYHLCFCQTIFSSL